MKTIIYTTLTNNTFIETQFKSIVKFFKTDYEFIVFDDSREKEHSTCYNKIQGGKIKDSCEKLKIKYIKIPQELHHNRGEVLPEEFKSIYKSNNVNDAHDHPVTRCALAVQYGFNYIINNYKNCYLFLIDSDMFFIDDFNIHDHMKHNHICGIGQNRDKINYLWNGIFICNLNKCNNLNEFNWEAGDVFELDENNDKLKEAMLDAAKADKVVKDAIAAEKMFIEQNKHLEKEKKEAIAKAAQLQKAMEEARMKATSNIEKVAAVIAATQFAQKASATFAAYTKVLGGLKIQTQEKTDIAKAARDKVESLTNKVGCDVGGHNYYYLKKYGYFDDNKDNILITCACFIYDLYSANFKFFDKKYTNLIRKFSELNNKPSDAPEGWVNKEFFFGTKILHIRGGGGWCFHKEEYHKDCIKLINEFINID